jgi:hypothetical protein
MGTITVLKESLQLALALLALCTSICACIVTATLVLPFAAIVFSKSCHALGLSMLSFIIVPASLALSVLTRWCCQPELLWVVYAGDTTQLQRSGFYPARDCYEAVLSWLALPVPTYVPISRISRGELRGLVVVLSHSIDELEACPELLNASLISIEHDFGHCKAIALAGRLPALAHRARLALPRPFITEQVGTVCMTTRAVKQLAATHGDAKPTSAQVVAVFGGAGYTGRQIVHRIARDFAEVIAIDPAFACKAEVSSRPHGPVGGTVVESAAATRASCAQIVLTFTPKGDDVRTAIEQAVSPGQLWTDDTHPQMSSKTRTAIQRAGAKVFKLTAKDPCLSMWPAVPGFHNSWLPGCLVTGLMVASESGVQGLDLSDTDACERAFDALGLVVRNKPHADFRMSALRKFQTSFVLHKDLDAGTHEDSPSTLLPQNMPVKVRCY